MKIRVAFFTENGRDLAERVFGSWQGEVIYRRDEQIGSFAAEAFDEQTPLIFIGAMGICIRAIAPYVSDKTKDIPVIVMDELGMHVIPVLSGHLGGAIELARRISDISGAEPVITTATDLNDVFAIDNFAKERGLSIKNPSKIKDVSAKALRGEHINIAIDVAISDTAPLYDALWLKPKNYILGIGTKKGKCYRDICIALEQFLEEVGVELEDIHKIASIDVKASEPGILEFSQRKRIPFVTYSADELAGLAGEFTHSDFVEQTVGVGCVSERAAMMAAGEGAQLVAGKSAFDGITFALAKRKSIMEI